MFKKIQPYLLISLITTTIFIGLALVYNFTPFGSETMLTIDLGQQYIDFFSLFKETVTNSPEMLIYSFEKAIGGEMMGLWAYYLLSPFNFIFLFFNESNFEIAVTLITYLKLLSASLTFMYFARSNYSLRTVPAAIFSLSYTLMSYTIVYLLNIMWLDGLILLPLIALGLNRLIKNEGNLLYVLSLALMLTANYYIGYMICLFLAMYAFYVIFERSSTLNLRTVSIKYGKFILYSLISAMIASITLLPTFYSLAQNKGSYFKPEFNFEVVHTFQDVMSKFFIGSFNFDEMSSGSPNLYAGMLILLLAVFYFINRKIKLSEKIISLLILTVFIVSFRFEWLDKLWHGGQFPIWYDFRFSFTATFFMIVLAIKAFIYQPKTFNLPLLLGAVGLISGFSAFYYWYGDYEFLNELKIFLSLTFALAFIIVIQLEMIQSVFRHVIILALVSAELFTNSVLILSELNYVQQSKFEDYTEILNTAVSGYRMPSDEFYRINKTFMRTKNEAMYVHYNGMDHFGSTIEAHVPELYGYLGLPDGNGFAVYTNGTIFLDDFFGIRYLLDISEDTRNATPEEGYVLHREATDLDLAHYPLIEEEARYIVRENDNAMGLGMEVSSDILETEFKKHQPIYNQELLLQLIDPMYNNQPYFESRSFDNVEYDNVTVTDTGDGDYYTYRNDSFDSEEEEARIRWHFSTNSENPYYFTLPSQYNSKNVSLQLNNQRYRIYTPYRNRQVTNASFDLVSDNQVFDVVMEEDSLQANLINLYEFDLSRYESLIATKSDNYFDVSAFKHNHIVGTIQTEQEEGFILFTIPFDEGWNVKVDGKDVQTHSVLNDTLLAVPITAGQHEIELKYFPRSIVIGLGLSFAGITALIGTEYINRKKVIKN